MSDPHHTGLTHITKGLAHIDSKYLPTSGSCLDQNVAEKNKEVIDYLSIVFKSRRSEAELDQQKKKKIEKKVLLSS